MLRIVSCSDAQRWYRHMVGQLVPHLGFHARDGFRSREPSGHVNFILAQDAQPTTVHVQPGLLVHWPFNHVESVYEARRLASAESAGTLMRPGIEQHATPAPAPATAGQSRRHSVFETVTNVAVGLVISYCLTATVLPAFGHQITPGQNAWITAIFTVASVLRSYALRRVFNWLHTKEAV